LPGSSAGKVLHNQVRDPAKRLVRLGELTVVRNFLSPSDQLVLKKEIAADFFINAAQQTS
jgi:hypothetical protein